MGKRKADTMGEKQIEVKQSVILLTGGDVGRLSWALAGLYGQHNPPGNWQIIVTGDLTADGKGAVEELLDHSEHETMKFVALPVKDTTGVTTRRTCAARNLGIDAAIGQQVIFLDGDCVPDPDFLCSHWEAINNTQSEEEIRFVYGCRRRLHMSKIEEYAGTLDIEGWKAHSEGDGRRGRSPVRQDWLTCNASAWREDLLAINGFDTTYDGSWGFEDCDAGFRLARLGRTAFNMGEHGMVTHLDHPRMSGDVDRDRYQTDFTRTFTDDKPIACPNGLVTV